MVSHEELEIPNVQFLIESIGSGGAERQMVELAAGLVRRGGSVQIVTWGSENFYCQGLDIPGIDLVFVPRRNRFDLRPLLHAVKWLRLGKTHLVHGFLDTGNLWAALAALLVGKRGAIVSHRTSWQRLPGLTRLHKTLAHHIAPITITNSKAGKRALIEHLHLPDTRIHVIRNGIDLEHFQPPTAEGRREMRAELGWSPEDLICLTVGTLYSAKNYLGYLDAISRANLTPNVHFVWCGKASPAELSRAREARQRLGLENRVTFIDRRCDIERLYGAADIFILFSKREGLPNVVLEAMACGLPVIASDVGDVSDLLHGELADGLVQPGNNYQLARVIEQFTSESPEARAARSTQGRIRIGALGLNSETMLERHLASYRSVL